MKAKIIDGQAIARAILREVAEEVTALQASYRFVPGLASLRVGEDPASQSYLQSEARACQEVGIRYLEASLPQPTNQGAVEKAIADLNAQSEVNGIIIQLPLPPHLQREKILETIRPEKDVDGLHPLNLGRLASKDGEPLLIPSTAKAVIHILDKSGVRLEGRRAVVVGRSNAVGFPVAHLLMRRDATVTICHSHTPDLGEVTRQADILVVAVGKTEIIRGEMVKTGAVVIDVGINQILDRQSKTGYRLVGDVAFEEVAEVARAITPVPGGVGPVTVAMLLQNTLTAAIRQGKVAGILPESYQSLVKL